MNGLSKLQATMSENEILALAGIAIFPVGEEYSVSVTLVSPIDGSFIGTRSSLFPVKLPLLPATFKAILSQFPDWKMLQYIASVPRAFPADRYHDIFHVLYSIRGIDAQYRWTLLNHGDAFSATLTKGTTVTVLLDFSSPDRLYTANFTSCELDGKRVNTFARELNIPMVKNEENLIRAALEKIIPDEFEDRPGQVVIIKAVGQLGERVLNIDGIVADIFPDIPVHTMDCEGISKAAAANLYAKSLIGYPYLKTRSAIGLPLPVSVATATGAVVPLSEQHQRIPVGDYVTLTNLVDNQKSVTVRLLLGNHVQARDNLLRAVAVLDGLKPLPKGEARIRVWIEIDGYDELWKDAATIEIEQDDGPRKRFIFPLFMANFPENWERYYIEVKKDAEYLHRSNEVGGELPE